MNRMEISEDWGVDVMAYTNNLPADTVSNFVTVPQGYYGLFWQYPGQVNTGEYYFYPDSFNNPEIFQFNSSQYYLFIVYEDPLGDPYVNLFNITPY